MNMNLRATLFFTVFLTCLKVDAWSLSRSKTGNWGRASTTNQSSFCSMEDGMKMKTRRYDSRRRQQSVNDFGREDQYLRTAEEIPTRRATHRKGSNQVYDNENGFRGRHLSESNGKYNYRGMSGSRGDRDVKRQQSADRVLTEGTHRHRQKKYRYMEDVNNAKFVSEADLPSTNNVHKDKKSKGVHGTGVSQQELSKEGEDINKNHTQHVFDDEAEDGEIRDSDDCETDENSSYTASKIILKENDKKHQENEGNRIADNKRVQELLLQENREKHEKIEENITSSTTSPTNDCNHQTVLEKDPGKGQRTYRVDQPREHCESHSNETKRGTKDEKDDHLSPCSIQELSLACQEDRAETERPSNTNTLCTGTTDDKPNESVKNTTKDVNKKTNGICAPSIYNHEYNNTTELRSRCDALFGEASGKKLFEVPDYTDLMQTMYEKYVNRPHPLARYLALEREYGLDAHIEFAEESTSSDTSKKRKSSKRKKPKRDRTTSKEKNCSVVTNS